MQKNKKQEGGKNFFPALYVLLINNPRAFSRSLFNDLNYHPNRHIAKRYKQSKHFSNCIAMPCQPPRKL